MSPEFTLHQRDPLAVQTSLAGRIKALEKRQDAQDSAQVRIENKLDALKMWILGAMLAVAGVAITGMGALLMFILGKLHP